MTYEDFITNIAYYVQKYAPQYDIRVHSPIIAQAILESAWGKSSLAYKYHNYFGLKCGTGWKGKSVNMQTKEEYSPGTMTTISDNFRVYDSMEQGVKGYFEFIQYSRYRNLKGVTDPARYLELIKADGYATASNYVQANLNVVRQYNLTRYDKTAVKAPTSDSDSVSDSAYTFTVGEVKLHTRGKYAALMQKCLKGLGYTGPNGTPLVIDADAGPSTIYALQVFQGRAGLEPDGVCGAESWKILLDL